TDLYRFADAESPAASGFSRTADRARSARPTIAVNGRALALALDKGYARIRRRWQKGDRVDIDLPMPIRRLVAHDAVGEDRGKAAIQRGPIVYCLEAVDNGGRVAGLTIPLDAPMTSALRRDLLGGVEVVSGEGFVAVPYYAWNNRGKGEMAVWVPYRN